MTIKKEKNAASASEAVFMMALWSMPVVIHENQIGNTVRKTETTDINVRRREEEEEIFSHLQRTVLRTGEDVLYEESGIVLQANGREAEDYPYLKTT
ncbi:MAG: hypothetical protein ACLTLQ_16520 [[Clostridium] scindens]